MAHISIIGLGKLGCPTLACLSEKFSVVGIDKDKEKVKQINSGISPVDEKGVPERIKEYKPEATTDYERILETEYTFIFVQTPSLKTGEYSEKTVIDVCRKISKVLAEKKEGHIVVLRSTVMIGVSRKCASLFKQENIHFVYQPEFIALGSAVEYIHNPSFLVFGCGDNSRWATNSLVNFYEVLLDKYDKIPVTITSYENTELIKLGFNAFSTVKISFANLLAEMCEKIPGGDIDAVTTTLLKDKRITEKCFTGGLGYGGPCLPRDDVAFSMQCNNLDMLSDLVDSAKNINRRTGARMVSAVRNLLRDSAIKEPVGFVGTTYKKGSSFSEASQASAVMNVLDSLGISVESYDSDVKEESLSVFLNKVETLFISKDFLEQKHLKNKYVIDVWRKYTHEGTKGYWAVGKEGFGNFLTWGA